MDRELMLDRIIDETKFAERIRVLVEQTARFKASAVVCTAELTPAEIDRARRQQRLVVRFDGIGFALMLEWKRRKAPHHA